MKRHLIIHYSEIGLKKGNKAYFVNKLCSHIRKNLGKQFGETFVVKHTLGRLVIALPEGFKEEEYVKEIQFIFGIKYFRFVYEGSKVLKKISEQIWGEMPYLSGFETFKVKVKRSMLMKTNSSQSEKEISADLFQRGIGLKAKMKDPDFEINVEFFNEKGFFSFKKYPGLGGLTSNSGGKLVSLMSAGIDSPVASFKMMKRGARVIFVHFHGYPYTDKDEMNQCKELVELLSKFQMDTKLYLVPFGQIQKDIATNLDIPAKVRTVLYRRMMVRIAENIARRQKAKGLVTGDNYGQVASQTPENMFTIHEASSIPLYQPLIAYDKEEIIEVARQIGTFDLSSLPCKDSCSMFMPLHPELRANPYDLRDFEEKLPVKEWVYKAIKDAEVIYF